jgi:hypothetical protein
LAKAFGNKALYTNTIGAQVRTPFGVYYDPVETRLEETDDSYSITVNGLPFNFTAVAVDTFTIDHPAEGLTAFLADPERSYEFTYDLRDATCTEIQVSLKKPYRIHDIHNAQLTTLDSNLVGKLVSPLIAEPDLSTFNSVKGAVLRSQRHDITNLSLSPIGCNNKREEL